MVWSDISKADWPIVAAKLEQIALLLRNTAAKPINSQGELL
nr:MAG TPA: hypothetical protein [Caudoviricetes sp.]